MINDLFFVISFCVCFIGLIFLFKVPDKISAFRSAVICFLTELCMGAVAAQAYSLLGVPICLVSMGSIYLLLGIGFWATIIKQKKMQKIALYWYDIYFIAVVIVGFILIFIKIFTPGLSNVYVQIDPANHYSWALRVLDSGKISNMYFAEVYNGLVLEIFQPFISRGSLYKAFILADSFAQLIHIFMFYTLATTVCKSRIYKFTVPFFSLFYFMGWPFSSYVVGGFVYYGWGSTLFVYVVYLLIQLYRSSSQRNRIGLIILVLLGGFATLICYMLFIPILALVVLCCLMIIKNKHNIEIPKQIKVGIIGIICVSGFIVASVFLRFFRGDLAYFLRILSLDGWIEKDLYRDFITLIPAALYMGWHYIKTKESNFICISMGIVLAYIVFTLPLCLCGIMSPYYFYKPYFLLWIFAWIMCLDAMEYFWKKDKAIVVIYGVALIFPMIMTLTGADAKLMEMGIEYDEKTDVHYSSIIPILGRNEYFLSGADHDIADREALSELCNYINDTFLANQNNLPLIGSDRFAGVWYTSFTGMEYIQAGSDEELQEAYLKCKEEDCDYIVIHQNTELYRRNVLLLDKFENVYSNGYYGIYVISKKNAF